MQPDPVAGMIGELNANIPVNRRTLSDYLENGDYTYRTRSGVTGTFDPAELRLLREVCTDAESARLRLPILVSTDHTAGHGAWRVDGRTESAVVSRLLDKVPRHEDRILMHHHEFVRVRKLLPELVTVVFSP
jgi:uncharacterized protein (UPF0216 family)